MAKTKSSGKKTGTILTVVFICLIIVATVCVLFLTPFGKRLSGIGKNDAPIKTTTTEVVSEVTETTSEKATIIIPTESTNPSVSIPEPSEPDIDTLKNYTFFIDKNTFDYTETEGITTLTAKDNKDVIITVTPYRTISYSNLCNQTAKVHEKDSEQPTLNTENLYGVYHSDLNGTTTTVYCIDDGIGGSIKLKYERPSNADKFDKDFEILVSMFKVK